MTEHDFESFVRHMTAKNYLLLHMTGIPRKAALDFLDPDRDEYLSENVKEIINTTLHAIKTTPPICERN